MPTDPFILLKGEPKTFSIEKIDLGNRGVYNIQFKHKSTTFHYRYNDVVILDNPIWNDPKQCKVIINGHEETNVSDIQSFQQGNLTHWRITFSNGYVRDYLHGTIHVVHSCLGDKEAKNSFEYLKHIATVNNLGKDEENGGILPSLYDSIEFIDDKLAVAPYLDPAKNPVRQMLSSPLIFPFGCNASQEKAVSAAFQHQLSVIQGPPGTGKTQTILNIIANILLQGKTVMIVSNNNSATANVLEKLQKYHFHFIVASLGKRENKEEFIKDQPSIPDDLNSWTMPSVDRINKSKDVSATLVQLRQVYALQEELALSKQELKDIDLEWTHFKTDNAINDDTYSLKKHVKSNRLMTLWLQYQAYAEGDILTPHTFIGRIKSRIRWTWLNFMRKHRYGIHSPFNPNNLHPTILELQSLYYITRIQEITHRISDINSQLASLNAKTLSDQLTNLSMQIFKDTLHQKYHESIRTHYADVAQLRKQSKEFLQQYPVILSTTFSARTSLPDTVVYDYIIMDEASQVSIETGALALTTAQNAVIVGDTLQLPNVVTNEDRKKLDAIFHEFHVATGYDSARYSFLQSVCAIIPDIPQTLLREHYRCHPKIINFCNQKFYGGNLLIMTEDHDEDNVLAAIKTRPGNHCRSHLNQREIDVVKEELLPQLNDQTDIGIITPYNEQVDHFNQQLPAIETATIHKYQGREKDTIIMSAVDDQITTFSDDPNLLNVAISRAKKHFCIVLTGNEQKHKGNISELVDYISYNNFTVADSTITSIFDYLYSHYTQQRISLLSNSRHISAYDSENLTYKLLTDIIREYPEFHHLGILCHTPLRTIIRDNQLMNDQEQRYVSHYSTHVDFLIINHVTKKPLLAIETDGYTYHNEQTEQHQRDQMKDHILSIYHLPLLRLSTIGHDERKQVLSALQSLIVK